MAGKGRCQELHQALNQQTVSTADPVLALCRALGTSQSNLDPVPNAFIQLQSSKRDTQLTNQPIYKATYLVSLKKQGMELEI